MATHFSILAWEILLTEEPGQLQSMGYKGLAQRLSTFAQSCFTMVYYFLLYDNANQL